MTDSGSDSGPFEDGSREGGSREGGSREGGSREGGAASPRRRTNPLAVVAVLVFAMATYFVLIGIRGVYLLDQPKIVLKVLGVAVLVLPLVGVWIVVAELRFGAASERLARQLIVEGGSTELPDMPRRRSGRVDRAAADAWFEVERAAVQASPDDWHGWFRLAQSYEAAGDRKRARAAMRTAIELESPTA